VGVVNLVVLACVLRATTKKINFFGQEKCTPRENSGYACVYEIHRECYRSASGGRRGGRPANISNSPTNVYMYSRRSQHNRICNVYRSRYEKTTNDEIKVIVCSAALSRKGRIDSK